MASSPNIDALSMATNGLIVYVFPNVPSGSRSGFALGKLISNDEIFTSRPDVKVRVVSLTSLARCRNKSIFLLNVQIDVELGYAA